MKAIFHRKCLKTSSILLAISISQAIFCQQGWYQLSSGTSSNLRSVYFINSNTGYVVGLSGTILKTTDGDVNWGSQLSGSSMLTRSKSETNSNTEIRIYDILGKEVATLVNEELKAGIYYYKLITGSYSETKKMTLIK
jgi:hypothetical protein